MILRGLTASCLLLLCASPPSARAQQSVPSVADPAAYEDRLIDGGALAPDVSTGLASGHDESGWPRSFRAQAIASRVSRDDLDQDENGVRLAGMIDTPNFGAFSLEATLRSSDGTGDDSGSMFTLYQLGLPMDGGWLADNALGVSNSPAVDLARSQYRFFVPVMLNNGLATEWRSEGGVQLQASAGEPGQLTGIYVPTFEGLGGRQVSAGAQWNAPGGWSVALQGTDVQDSLPGLGAQPTLGEISGQSWLGALGWRGADARAQLNAMLSGRDGADDHAGVWLDGDIRTGRLVHTAGAFHMDEDLFWGTQAMASDMQGGYYRATFQSRQWLLDGGFDYVAPVTGDGTDTVYFTGYSRYQYSSTLGAGGGANLRNSDTTAWSAFAFVDRENRWGLGRSQLDYATDDDRSNAQLTLNQTWRSGPSTRFSTAVTVGRDEFDGRGTNIFGLAVNGGGNLRSDMMLVFDASWDTGSGRESYDSLLGNVALNWNFLRGFSLGANYYVNRTSGRLPLEVESPIPGQPAFVERDLQDQGIYVSLRYDWQAGTRFAPLGGPADRGAGRIAGILYLDDNANGRQDAGEVGAPNVVILLNGRFAARTDVDGRFEFPAVASGTHVLTVVTDNLPLPWIFPQTQGVSVKVGVRDQLFVPLGAQRLR